MNKETISLPPAWCSPICTNSMNDLCVEGCAVKRDCSQFELKQGIALEKLPRFPLNQTKVMTKQEKFIALTVYISKLTDYLKGVEDGTDNDYPGSIAVSKNLQKQNLLPGEAQRDPSHQDRT